MRKGIALLITLLFIMLITISIGIGLKQVNQASTYTKSEKFLYQSSMILDNVLTILKTSKELENINSSSELDMFLSQSSLIPFEVQGIKVRVNISSARSKFNINTLVDANHKTNMQIIEPFKQYMSNQMINTGYVDILLSSMGINQDNISYISDLFDKKPNLFREYITSQKHLYELNDFYKSYYHDDNLKNIDFEKLFSYSNDKNYKIDLSFATPEVWELMLECDKQRAIDLSSNIYESQDDIDLSAEEKKMLSRFAKSTFEHFLDVHLNISQNNQNAHIKFEYDIENKKGFNFVYEI